MKNMEIHPLSNVSKNEIVTEESSCPSCLMEREAKATECRYCGIVFSQYYRWSKEKRTKLTISGLYHLSVSDIEMLEAAWSRVESLYVDRENHDDFLHLCRRLKSLPFAAHCYTQRQRLFPDDEIATLQLGKIIALSGEWFGAEAAEERSPFDRGLMRMAAALAVIGVAAGVLTLFTGLLTSTPVFYMGAGSFVIASCVVIFAVARGAARQAS